MLPLWYKVKTHGYIARNYKGMPDPPAVMERDVEESVKCVSSFFNVGNAVGEMYDSRSEIGMPFCDIGICKPVSDVMWCEHSRQGITTEQVATLSKQCEDGSWIFFEFQSIGDIMNGRPCIVSTVEVKFDEDGATQSICDADYCKGVYGGLATGITLFAMAFAHCKNVTTVDFQESQPSDKWHRRTKCPRVQFKTIKIPTRAPLLRAVGQLTAGGVKSTQPLPLHLVRGHFATYTADKPLFGRADGVGKFWHPQHIRGDERGGVVVKDYDIG